MLLLLLLLFALAPPEEEDDDDEEELEVVVDIDDEHVANGADEAVGVVGTTVDVAKVLVGVLLAVTTTVAPAAAATRFVRTAPTTRRRMSCAVP